MAYTKNTWRTGDIVSSQKLNHMEDGIANAYEVMVITVVTEDPAQSAKNLLRGGGGDIQFLDKTWQEIYDAIQQGKMCAIRNDTGSLEGGITIKTVTGVYVDAEQYTVGAGDWVYYASSATGYPRSMMVE